MSSAGKPIPSFRKPPVVEVVWSLQFDELKWLKPPDTGTFWSLIKDDFPKCEEQNLIPHVTEREHLFATEQKKAEWLPLAPLNRLWFISQSETELVQLQRDRLCFNWRKTRAEDEYPRYDYLRNRFHATWRAFCQFVQEAGHETPQVDQCELTYTNHLLQGESWSEVADISDIFLPLSLRQQKDFLPSPRTFACRLVFDLAGEGGRLHVNVRHGRKEGEQEPEAFVLDLTARGAPQTNELEGLLDWFSTAHKWIVGGFADLTAPTMHNRWEREK